MKNKIELYKNLQRKTPDQIVHGFLVEDNFEGETLYSKNENIFYKWEDGFYQPIDETAMKKCLWAHVNQLKLRKLFPEDKSISASTINNIYETLKLAHSKVTETTNTPYIGFNDKKCLSLKDFTFQDSSVEMPIFFGLDFPSSTVLDPSICPVFQNFLKTTLVKKETLEPDEKLILFVQEIFGYCLTNTVAAHATFFFYGSGRNGKSVLLDILRSIIGEKYISSMSIQTLTTQRFAPANLVGKKLNIASEEESKFIKCDTFKSLVAGDPMTVEQKHKDPFEYRPNAKFLFATNRIPIFDSADVAIRDRVFIIPFNRYLAEQERDHFLINKLKPEIGGILAWALEGAKRVIDNDYRFTVPDSVREMGEEFQNEQSSALAFIKENFQVTGDTEDYIIKARMYKFYTYWCADNGRRKKSSETFFKDILSVYRGKIKTDTRRNMNGIQTRVVTGVIQTEDESAYLNMNIRFP
ncbi:MAG: phage/plasmid primase, P4 family [Patescibacteria group bacterium]